MLTGFVVDTPLDNPSAGPGDMDGLVSLREAITAANTNFRSATRRPVTVIALWTRSRSTHR